MDNKDRALENATDCMESTKLADVISLWVTELNAAEQRGRERGHREAEVRWPETADIVRTQAINDCTAAARAVMLGHEKDGAPLMATGAVSVEMALEAMLKDTPARKER